MKVSAVSVFQKIFASGTSDETEIIDKVWKQREIEQYERNMPKLLLAYDLRNNSEN